jgi:aspartyl-tRNA(Asn)/glutamyl-tRNA(Gln) amidotransferase subunit A
MGPANMLGLPGLSLPVGASSREGGTALPIGLQLLAAPWREATLLRAGAALAAALPAAGVVLPGPLVHINPLAGNS